MVEPKDVSKKHFYISLVKSGLRIIGCLLLLKPYILGFGIMFLIAELLGIAEEL